MLDTNVLIRAERRRGQFDFQKWQSYGDVFISAITVSELLIGVHRADTESRRVRRSDFVEAILAKVPVLDFTRRSRASMLAFTRCWLTQASSSAPTISSSQPPRLATVARY